jgi:hypothetical protein
MNQNQSQIFLFSEIQEKQAKNNNNGILAKITPRIWKEKAKQQSMVPIERLLYCLLEAASTNTSTSTVLADT